MKNWFWRVRYLSLTLTSGGLLALGGCGLSDQQLTTIWQSVIQSGLNALVGNVINTLVSATQAAA